VESAEVDTQAAVLRLMDKGGYLPTSDFPLGRRKVKGYRSQPALTESARTGNLLTSYSVVLPSLLVERMVKIQLEGGLTMRAKLLPVIIFCLLFVCASGLAEELSQVRLLRASLVEGDVTYQRPDLDRWIDLSVNTPLLEGDKVWVGNNGRTEIEFEDGTFLRMSSDSILELSQLGPRSGSDQIEMQFVRGIGSFEIQPSGMTFVINTLLFSMRVKDAASFRVDLEEDGTGRMAVFDGSIEVAGDKAHLYVRKGEIIQFQSQDPDRYFLSADYQQDNWDRWNEERTAYIAKRQERYHDGDAGWTMADMDDAGNWYTDSEYGRVWSPGLGADWTPYRNGRWVWYDDLGWTWVSYESWGWVPYHYGRWTYLTSYGWSWVPGPRNSPWCPGAVSWIEGPNWIGWVPLAPSEPWYGYSSGNVLISKNYQYRHGRTCLPRDSFLNGTPARDFVPPGDPSHAGRVLSGQPRYVPTTASRLPVLTSSSPSRVYSNADLESRRLMRERTPNTPDSASGTSATSTPTRGAPISSTSNGANSVRQDPRQPISSTINSRGGTMSVQTSANGVRTYIIRGSSSETTAREEQARQQPKNGETTAQTVPTRDAAAGSSLPSSRFAQTTQDVSARSRNSGSSPSVTFVGSDQPSGRPNESTNPNQDRFPAQPRSRETTSPRYNFYNPPVGSAPASIQAPSYSAPRVEVVSPQRSQPASNPPPASRPPISSTGSSVYRAPAVSTPSPPSYQAPSGQAATGSSNSRSASPAASTAAGNAESRGNTGARSGR
jgi:hypothetical protein